jgi:hypothetical protein
LTTNRNAHEIITYTMPATASSRPAGTANERADSNAFIDNYLADWNDDDNPFRSPSPEPAGKKAKDDGKKKKDILGIEKELDLKKKPRAPRVKLDEARFVALLPIHSVPQANPPPTGSFLRKESQSCGRWPQG